MHSVILKNGEIINVEADKMSWDVEDKTISFFNRKDPHYLVSVFNVDSIAGWVNTNYTTESKIKDER